MIANLGSYKILLTKSPDHSPPTLAPVVPARYNQRWRCFSLMKHHMNCFLFMSSLWLQEPDYWHDPAIKNKTAGSFSSNGCFQLSCVASPSFVWSSLWCFYVVPMMIKSMPTVFLAFTLSISSFYSDSLYFVYVSFCHYNLIFAHPQLELHVWPSSSVASSYFSAAQQSAAAATVEIRGQTKRTHKFHSGLSAFYS